MTNSELVAEACRVQETVDELHQLVHNLQGSAAQIVAAAEEGDQLLVQTAAAHLLTHLLRLNEGWVVRIAAGTMGIGRHLLDRLDEESREVIEELSQALKVKK